jgi:RNA polymerase sigma factor
MQVIDALLQNKELILTIKNKKYLPIAEIEKITKVPRKTIERARNYIIAVVLIRDGDYQYINSFVSWR